MPRGRVTAKTKLEALIREQAADDAYDRILNSGPGTRNASALKLDLDLLTYRGRLEVPWRRGWDAPTTILIGPVWDAARHETCQTCGDLPLDEGHYCGRCDRDWRDGRVGVASRNGR